MRGAVIYYDRWGPCKWVAEEITCGLREEGHEVYLMDMRSVVNLSTGLGLFLVAGCASRGPGLPLSARRLVGRLDPVTLADTLFATFGTGPAPSGGCRIPGSAELMMEHLISNSLRPLAPPFTALVKDPRGPLAEGELCRALRFGRHLGEMINSRKERGSTPGSMLEAYLRTRFDTSKQDSRRRAS